MAVFTSKANGNWSSSGQTTWTQVGVPGDGDTVTISHNVIVDVNTTIGSDVGSAIAAGSSSVKTLTINSGVTLTVKGDISVASSTWLNVIVSAGGTLRMYPASSAQLKLTAASWPLQLTCNGTAISHATITTDKSRGGLNSWMDVLNSRPGLVTATYTDFFNFGDTTHSGIVSAAGSSDAAVSITNCTFSNCNYKGSFASTFHFDFTFSNNVFSSSAALSFGSINRCSFFNFNAALASETRVISGNSFDLSVSYTYNFGISHTDNYFGDGFSMTSGLGVGWSSDAGFARNTIVHNDTVNVIGSAKDCYFLNTNSGNPHYLIIDDSLTTPTYTGLIFECTGTGGAGDCIFTQNVDTGTPTLTVKNCIVLPDSSGKTSGKLISDLVTTNVAHTVEHNTYCSTGGESGLISMSETQASIAGNVASCRANISWSSTVSTNNYAVFSQPSGPAPAIDAVTVAGYNGFWNPNTGTCFYNSSTSQAGVVGYQNIKISPNTPYPNATVGTGDVSGDPGFVDSTRDIGSWGTTRGADGTAAGALALLAANPALLGQSTTGLLAWVRAGFRPTNTAFKAVSYPGDTATVDAAGNAWTGASPDLGAIAFSGTPAPVTSGGVPYPTFVGSPSKPVPMGW